MGTTVNCQNNPMHCIFRAIAKHEGFKGFKGLSASVVFEFPVCLYSVINYYREVTQHTIPRNPVITMSPVTVDSA